MLRKGERSRKMTARAKVIRAGTMGMGLYGAFTITQDIGGEADSALAQAARGRGADIHKAAACQIAGG
jgi:hypothetical protein